MFINVISLSNLKYSAASTYCAIICDRITVVHNFPGDLRNLYGNELDWPQNRFFTIWQIPVAVSIRQQIFVLVVDKLLNDWNMLSYGDPCFVIRRCTKNIRIDGAILGDTCVLIHVNFNTSVCFTLIYMKTLNWKQNYEMKK